MIGTLTLYILVLSPDKLCKQFRSRSGPTKHQILSASKLFATLMVILKEFFEKVYFEKIQQTTKNFEKFPSRTFEIFVLIVCMQQSLKKSSDDKKSMQNYPVGKALNISLFDPNSKTCVKRLLSKRPKIGFQDQLSLNAGRKYFRMLKGEHSAILSTFIKLPIVIKIFVLSILSGRFTQVLLYIVICPFIRPLRLTL